MAARFVDKQSPVMDRLQKSNDANRPVGSRTSIAQEEP